MQIQQTEQEQLLQKNNKSMQQEKNLQKQSPYCIIKIILFIYGLCLNILNYKKTQQKEGKSSEQQPLNKDQDKLQNEIQNNNDNLNKDLECSQKKIILKKIDFCLPYNGLANHNREYDEKRHILKDIELEYYTSFNYQCQRQVGLYGLMAKNRQSIDNFVQLFGYTLEKKDNLGIQAFIIDDNMFVFYNLNENNDDYNLEHQLKSFLIKTTQTIVMLDQFENDDNLLCEFKKMGQIKDKQLVYLHQCQMKDSYFSDEKKTDILDNNTQVKIYDNTGKHTETYFFDIGTKEVFDQFVNLYIDKSNFQKNIINLQQLFVDFFNQEKYSYFYLKEYDDIECRLNDGKIQIKLLKYNQNLLDEQEDGDEDYEAQERDSRLSFQVKSRKSIEQFQENCYFNSKVEDGQNNIIVKIFLKRPDFYKYKLSMKSDQKKAQRILIIQGQLIPFKDLLATNEISNFYEYAKFSKDFEQKIIVASIEKNLSNINAIKKSKKIVLDQTLQPYIQYKIEKIVDDDEDENF